MYPLSHHILFNFMFAWFKNFLCCKGVNSYIFTISNLPPFTVYPAILDLPVGSIWNWSSAPPEPHPDLPATVGAAWRSPTIAVFQSFRLLSLTLTEIIIQCPGDGASGAARKALARRTCSPPRTEGICCGKWQPLPGRTRLQEVPYPTFFFPLPRNIF